MSFFATITQRMPQHSSEQVERVMYLSFAVHLMSEEYHERLFTSLIHSSNGVFLSEKSFTFQYLNIFPSSAPDDDVFLI